MPGRVCIVTLLLLLSRAAVAIEPIVCEPPLSAPLTSTTYATGFVAREVDPQVGMYFRQETPNPDNKIPLTPDTICGLFSNNPGIALQCAIKKYPKLTSFLWYVSSNLSPDQLTANSSDAACVRILSSEKFANSGFDPQVCGVDGMLTLMHHRKMSLQLAFEPSGSSIEGIAADLKNPESTSARNTAAWAERLAQPPFNEIPQFLRPMSEMTLPDPAWSVMRSKKPAENLKLADSYASAWKSMRKIFREKGAPSKFVFSPPSFGFISPGQSVLLDRILGQIKDDVDLPGVNPYPDSQSSLPPKKRKAPTPLSGLLAPFRAFYAKRLPGRPLFVSETGVVGTYSAEQRAKWYADAFKHVNNSNTDADSSNDIAGITIFNSDGAAGKYKLPEGSSANDSVTRGVEDFKYKR